MSGLFRSGDQADPRMQEGYVVSVDPRGRTCQVKTTNGRTLQSVRCLSPTGGSGRAGDHSLPSTGDRVLVSFFTGSPLILGCLPAVTATMTPPLQVLDSSMGVSTGDTSKINGATTDPGAPKDALPGDFIKTSEGGGFFGLLKSGGLLLKAGGVAQFFMSKFEGFVRIVAKNFHLYTDVHSETYANIGGKVYGYKGFAQTQDLGRAENFAYQEYYGNVAAGVIGKSKRRNLGAMPGPDGRMRLITCGAMTETVTTGGIYTRFVAQAQLTHDETSWQVLTAGGPVIVRVDPDKVLVKYKEKTVTLNAGGIEVKADNIVKVNAPTIELKGSGCTATVSSGLIVSGGSYSFE